MRSGGPLKWPASATSHRQMFCVADMIRRRLLPLVAAVLFDALDELPLMAAAMNCATYDVQTARRTIGACSCRESCKRAA
jgi:hypothetical protein